MIKICQKREKNKKYLPKEGKVDKIVVQYYFLEWMFFGLTVNVKVVLVVKRICKSNANSKNQILPSIFYNTEIQLHEASN